MPNFKSIHTSYGLAQIAAAEASGVPINLTHVAVGDGNGNPVTPDEAQTQLVREMFRTTVNRVYPDPNEPTRFTVEMVIPVTEGGFTLREVGVFDAAGGLFAVGNLPDTYKPTLAEGAFTDTVVRFQFLVANADIITVQIDPNVAVATQQWITNNVTAGALIPGGTTNQILKKASNADGDTYWGDPDVSDVVVTTIEEHQTLAASQTVVTLADVTTNGLAVYIEGVRIDKVAGADGWLPDDDEPDVKVVLGKSYPAGSAFTGVQNEPLGSAPFPLARNQNGADIQSKPAFRANLDVYSKAEVRALVPPGIIDHYAGETAPPGWLVRNGAAISRTAYADLFAVIGVTFGAGDGFTTFNLPDDRGLFDRGFNGTSDRDVGRVFGSYQGDAIRNIKGVIGVCQVMTPPDSGAFYHTYEGASVRGDDSQQRNGKIWFDASRVVPTAAENRVKNRAYLPIIKF